MKHNKTHKMQNILKFKPSNVGEKNEIQTLENAIVGKYLT